MGRDDKVAARRVRYQPVHSRFFEVIFEDGVERDEMIEVNKG